VRPGSVQQPLRGAGAHSLPGALGTARPATCRSHRGVSAADEAVTAKAEAPEASFSCNDWPAFQHNVAYEGEGWHTSFSHVPPA
jgi:hypothetical protein